MNGKFYLKGSTFSFLFSYNWRVVQRDDKLTENKSHDVVLDDYYTCRIQVNLIIQTSRRLSRF